MSTCYDKLRHLKYSYFHKPGTEPLQYITVGRALDESTTKWPDQVAIISHYENISLTFKQLKEQVDQLRAGLLALGLKPGDRLALLGVNTVHWFLTMLAAAKAGIIVGLLNPAYCSEEIGYTLKKISAKVIVMDHKFKSQDYHSILAELIPGISSAPHGQPLSLPELPDLSFAIVATEEKLPGSYRWKDLVHLTKCKEDINKVESNILSDDPFCIIFTSGTTGVPKATVVSHFGIINNSDILNRKLGNFNKNRSICLQPPFFHIFGLGLGPINVILNGHTIILPSPTFRKELTVEVLHKYNCEILYGTPTMFIDLISELKVLLPKSSTLSDAIANVKILGLGGSVLGLELINSLSETFPHAEIYSGFGMTETSSAWAMVSTTDSIEKKATTVGQVLDHVEVKVVDKNGKMVPFSQPGEAWVRSYGSFLEYWGDEENTKEMKTKDGWVKTGDIMILWEDGYLSIAGRAKDMIIRGGENIFPNEIENFLRNHPDIAEAEVVGVSDQRMGEEVSAWIILKPGSTLTEKNLKEYCRGKISHFKIPRYVKFVDNYPRTPIGKVKKFLIRKLMESELSENHYEFLRTTTAEPISSRMLTKFSNLKVVKIKA